MKTQFDKIYVLSLITNKERQEFIKYQMNELELEFEFIYGIDYSNFTKDINGNDIQFPPTFNNNTKFKLARDFGCTISHYTAINYAYYHNYKNVLVIEDDICFLKNKSLIEYYLNNIPQETDFISFDVRYFKWNDEFKSFFINEFQKELNYISIPNDIQFFGGMMYGIMNRATMELYLNNQHNKLVLSDNINGVFYNSNINRVTSKNIICTDIQNIKHNFNYCPYPDNDKVYSPIYKMYYELKIDDFFNPINVVNDIYSKRFNK